MKQYSKILKDTSIALNEEGIVPVYLYHIELMCVIGIYKHTRNCSCINVFVESYTRKYCPGWETKR